MLRARSSKVRLSIVMVLVLLLSVVAYGFAASNTVPATNAGDGDNTISGYTITNVHYELGTDPTFIDSVEFTIAPGVPSATGTVQVRLVAGGDWYTCTASSDTAWACTIGNVTVLAADRLQVVAAQ